jgi:two-component system OmpR family sensor kinase
MMLGNLLTNVRVHAGADAAVTIALEPHGAGYLLDVADTGPGVPASALPQLFDRFYRATPATQRSSGLGLAIVAAVVESHGGTVRAELAQPAGLRIITELPRTRS